MSIMLFSCPYSLPIFGYILAIYSAFIRIPFLVFLDAFDNKGKGAKSHGRIVRHRLVDNVIVYCIPNFTPQFSG